jgi:hypothetical protein
MQVSLTDIAQMFPCHEGAISWNKACQNMKILFIIAIFLNKYRLDNLIFVKKVFWTVFSLPPFLLEVPHCHFNQKVPVHCKSNGTGLRTKARFDTLSVENASHSTCIILQYYLAIYASDDTYHHSLKDDKYASSEAIQVAYEVYSIRDSHEIFNPQFFSLINSPYVTVHHPKRFLNFVSILQRYWQKCVDSEICSIAHSQPENFDLNFMLSCIARSRQLNFFTNSTLYCIAWSDYSTLCGIAGSCDSALCGIARRFLKLYAFINSIKATI